VRSLARLSFVLTFASVGSANAATPEECQAALETARALARSSRLVESRKALSACAQRTCPSTFIAECTKMATSVDERVPTFVLSAKTSKGEEITDVAATLDGKPFLPRLDGAEHAIDPGQHVLELHREGMIDAEQTFLAKEREHGRALAFTFSAKPRDEPPIPTLFWVLGGVSILGLGGFAILQSAAISERDDLRDRCAPRCTPDDVDSVDTLSVAAKVALGMGIAAGAGAASALFLHRTRPAVVVGNGGVVIGARGAF
jgi:hypothetical protein